MFHQPYLARGHPSRILSSTPAGQSPIPPEVHVMSGLLLTAVQYVPNQNMSHTGCDYLD